MVSCSSRICQADPFARVVEGLIFKCVWFSGLRGLNPALNPKP